MRNSTSDGGGTGRIQGSHVRTSGEMPEHGRDHKHQHKEYIINERSHRGRGKTPGPNPNKYGKHKSIPRRRSSNNRKKLQCLRTEMCKRGKYSWNLLQGRPGGTGGVSCAYKRAPRNVERPHGVCPPPGRRGGIPDTGWYSSGGIIKAEGNCHGAGNKDTQTKNKRTGGTGASRTRTESVRGIPKRYKHGRRIVTGDSGDAPGSKNRSVDGGRVGASGRYHEREVHGSTKNF